jgi:hypothetical protein
VLIVADHVLGNGRIEALGGSGYGSLTPSPEELKNEPSKHSHYGGRGGDGHIIIRSPDLPSIRDGKMKCYPICRRGFNIELPDLRSLRLEND